MGNNLKLESLAIGSVPHLSLEEVKPLLEECFVSIPFWPQMVKVSKNEDMTIQFLENMPSFFIGKSYLDVEYDEFYDDLEKFFLDYETIISEEDVDDEIIDRYGISKTSASAFPYFFEFVKKTKPQYAKGQIVGPFTLTTTLVDKDGRCVIYDETLKELVIKTLVIKAIWQIKQIKKANKETIPIIFIDEPSISQLGTSAYVSVLENEVLEMLEEVSSAIQKFGGMSAIHCCGKCDWKVPIMSGINMLNLDAYGYAQNLSVYSKEVEKFLKDGNKIVWGVVPTLDRDALEKADLSILENRFEKAIDYLVQKGIDKSLVINNSLISTSCGAGSLSEELTQKAFRLTKQLSQKLKERYNDI